MPEKAPSGRLKVAKKEAAMVVKSILNYTDWVKSIEQQRDRVYYLPYTAS